MPVERLSVKVNSFPTKLKDILISNRAPEKTILDSTARRLIPNNKSPTRPSTEGERKMFNKYLHTQQHYISSNNLISRLLTTIWKLHTNYILIYYYDFQMT